MNLGICTRLENLASSQYADWTFNSLVSFNGQTVAFGPDGVCELGGDTDNGAEIDAIIELPTVDFVKQARMREAYVGYETDGALVLKTTADETETTTYSLAAAKNTQHGARVPMKRTGRGRYWMLRIENVDGCDFGLDLVEIRPVILPRRN